MPVRVIHGANEGCFRLAGKTIAQVARHLKDVFNIPSDADASVNGQAVGHDHRIADDDTVEFVRTNGAKGGVHEFWSESEIIEMFGDNAIEEMVKADIKPSRHLAYTADQVSSWQAARMGKPAPMHGLIVDPETFTVSYQGQEPAYLGNTIPFRLLERLAKRPGIFVDFRRLRVEVWKDDMTRDSTISRTASRLGKILKSLGVEGVTVQVEKNCVRIRLD